MPQSAPPSPSQPNELAARLGAITERYILTVVYFAFAYSQWGWVRYDWVGVQQQDHASLGYLSTNGTMFVLDLIMGLVLLIGRRAAAAPRTLEELLVPLAASFYFLIFSFVPMLPSSLGWLTVNHTPLAWQDSLNYASLVIAALGTIFSLWGLVSLGRSFGIFVAVRTIVLRGPYRFVRHPMYCGYIVMSFALLLSEGSLAILILMIGQAALFAWRARLEEARLSEFSADYRAYQQRTGFFFPKLGRVA